MSLRAIVIGLGQIGMGYDLKLPADSHVYTHARALSLHPAFELIAGVEGDAGRRAEFADAFKAEAYATIADVPADANPEIITIAVPTVAHASVVAEVLSRWKPKAILCEKPLAYSLDEARRIVDLCQQSGCQLYVNYMRLSDPGVLEIKRRLDAEEIRTPAKGVVWYSKGLFNNGSHFFGLLEYWLGDMLGFDVVAKGRVVGDDCEPDFVARFEKGTVHFLAAREEDFSHYTIELVSPSGRLRYEQGGERIVWQTAASSTSSAGYTVLQAEEQLIANDLGRYQWHVLEQMNRSLNKEAASICTGKSALRTLEHLTEIRNAL